MRRLVATLAAVAALSLVGCPKRSDDGTSPRARELPALVLRDDTPDLLLTYMDEKGDFFTAMRVDDVPLDRRDAVRVVVTTRDEGSTTNLVYVADLRQKRPDGTYPVVSMTRAEWEGLAEQRRRGKVAQAPRPEPTPAEPKPGAEPHAPGPQPPSSRVVVHIYGASWCGPCHDAQAYLRRRGVAVVYHDVEAEPGADNEMRMKLSRAGVRGGSIPVIDVAGRVMVGFDPRALDAALAEAAKQQGTLL